MGKKIPELKKTRLTGKTIDVISLANNLLSDPTLPEIKKGECYFYLAEGLRENGNHFEAENNYQKALKKIDFESNSKMWFSSKIQLIDLNYVKGDLRNAKTDYKKLLDLVDNDKMIVSNIIRGLGHIELIEGRNENAYEFFKDSLYNAEESRSVYKIIESYNSLAEALVANDPERSYSLLKKVKKLALSSGFMLEYGKSLYIEAEILNDKTKYQEALKVGLESLHILTNVQYASGIARSKILIARSLLGLKQYQKGREYIFSAIEYYDKEEIYPRYRNKSYQLLERLRS